MSISGELVERIAAVDYDQLPKGVVETAKHVLLDGIGVTIAGRTEPTGLGELICRYVRSCGGEPQASVLGSGFKTSVPQAAFANGTMAHALDFDNTWYPLNHPTSPTAPVVLALAESHRLDGRSMIEALVAAFEVQGRLRMAATGLKTGQGFHKPGTTGTFGAVTAAIKLLRLDHRASLMALGIAGSRAGSLSKNTGTMTKASHSGHAARMGVESAQLASMGWTATDDVFGPGGFLDTFLGDDHDDPKLIDGFGAPFRMADPGVGFKKYPCNYYTHRGIDAALHLRRTHRLGGGDIASVEVRFPRFDYVNRPRPVTGLDGKFSVQYTVAIAFLDGAVGIDSFTDARRFAPDVEDLLPRVSLVVDDSVPQDFERTRTTVVVRTTTGATVEHTTERLTGMHGIPLTEAERLSKFHRCAERVVGQTAAARIVDLVEDLPSLVDPTELLDLARGPHPTSAEES